MKKLLLIFVTATLTIQVFSQENFVHSGWINSEVELGQNSSDKLKQAKPSSSGGEHADVWLESAEGWLKLHYSVQAKQKKNSHAVYEEAIPIYDGGTILWDKNRLHRFDGPNYFFEFRIFDISNTGNTAGRSKVSLYYRWVFDNEVPVEKKNE